MEDPKPPATSEDEDGPDRSDAPHSGEIEWAGGFVPTPPAPGEVRVGSDRGPPPGAAGSDRPDDAATKSGATVTPPEDEGGRR